MIVDFHTHAFPDDLAPRAIDTLNAMVPPGSKAVLGGTVGGLLDSMVRAGIDTSVICSIATAPKQVDAIRRWSLSVGSDRICPFCSIHPETDDPPAAVKRTAECGLKGIKLHPLYQNFEVDSARMWPLYAAIEEAGLILVMHSGRDIAFPPEDCRAAPRRLLRVHRAFPQMTLVAAHLGGWRAWEQAADCLAGTDVYLETSYTFGMGADDAVARILERHPRERILFGTDSPWRDQKEAVDLVRGAFPDPAEQRLVLGGNAARLLKLDGAGICG